MSSLLRLALFASTATATVTTSIWVPALGSKDNSYFGSVIDMKDDKTTIAVSLNQTVRTSVATKFQNTTQTTIDVITVTVQGTTYFDSHLTGEGRSHSELCTQPTDKDRAVCTISANGAGVASSYCKKYKDIKEKTTVVGPGIFAASDTYTASLTIEPADVKFCSSTPAPTLLPTERAVAVYEFDKGKDVYALTITAGEEKLRPAEPTTTSSEAGAMPMITAAPVLAGLGMAMAAMVL
ncbi:hypothetical protein P154DRAFT_526102 [Amniculicola lignicola CBS 123094]|uniref:Uncharacterized protein n=1 Tax=Amniculicola lignicola CBS 123094 TaxID=1392246 RepID=A0A6A5W3M5_9PLEO|nr:hypothetical protein P154DRAFT_526102 [Amniculicola lignicola CBS 123094]